LKVKTQVEKIARVGGLSTLLVHPACMEICDGFKTFERLCEFISQYETISVNEIGRKYAQDSE
jgi:hypothetical protein